ncbi:22680_t:CDS:2 [Gigaspora margarita]|uniref:22680_t:CDS:1 n=1 Tax=Gigaspora margarita TaxID=4874 RepID=A0ABM8W3W9_GIGMA|nr:22680_t:CDS:2 [Gigaspora margarita]
MYTSDERYYHLTNGINPFSREQARQEEVSHPSPVSFDASFIYYKSLIEVNINK